MAKRPLSTQLARAGAYLELHRPALCEKPLTIRMLSDRVRKATGFRFSDESLRSICSDLEIPMSAPRTRVNRSDHSRLQSALDRLGGRVDALSARLREMDQELSDTTAVVRSLSESLARLVEQLGGFDDDEA